MSEKITIEATRVWLDDIVVGLNLCPFAQQELKANKVRFQHSSAKDEISLLQDLIIELQLLIDDDSVETTLLIHPDTLNNFLDFNQFLDKADSLIDELGLRGEFQLASFHPDYQFADTLPEAPENFTNRSPHPTLQLLREASVERAVASHTDIDSIPVKNIELMNQLGSDELSNMMQRIYKGI